MGQCRIDRISSMILLCANSVCFCWRSQVSLQLQTEGPEPLSNLQMPKRPVKIAPGAMGTPGEFRTTAGLLSESSSASAPLA